MFIKKNGAIISAQDTDFRRSTRGVNGRDPPVSRINILSGFRPVLIAVSTKPEQQKEEKMNTKLSNSKYLTQLALLVAIEIIMKLIGLGSVPVGPLYMSFLTLPIAIGAMLLGPTAGAILGGVFGAVSFYDAITGVSVMTGAFFQIAPFKTFVLCVITRIVMGICVGWIFKLLKSTVGDKNISYIIGALSAPVLNTLFFMGFIVAALYNTEYIQNLAASLHVGNPLSFVIAVVGLQGLVEAVVCCILGSIITRVLARTFSTSLTNAA